MFRWIAKKKSRATKSSVKSSQLFVDGLSVDVLRRRKKHVSLSVQTSSGDVRVIAPLKIDDEAIVQIVRRKFIWISRQRERVACRNSRFKRKFMPRDEDAVSKLYVRRFSKRLAVVDGSDHELSDHELGEHELGEHELGDHELVVRELAFKRSQRIRWDGGTDLRIRGLGTLDQWQKDSLIWAWYREQLEESAGLLLVKWELKMGVKVSKLKIRRMTTRWGTCNTRSAAVCLNLELIRRPYRCLEFVVVHELVHLLERGHTARFYRLMDEFLPRWRTYKAVLDATALTLTALTGAGLTGTAPTGAGLTGTALSGTGLNTTGLTN